VLNESFGKLLQAAGAAKSELGKTATSCWENCYKLLELLEESSGKLLQAVRAAKKRLGGNCYKLPVRAARRGFGETDSTDEFFLFSTYKSDGVKLVEAE
jgi:hypothetical protein